MLSPWMSSVPVFLAPLMLFTVHTVFSVSQLCSEDPVNFIDTQQCGGTTLHLLFVGVQPQMLASHQLTILTRAFHPLSDHTAGDGMAQHLWKPTSTLLHQSKHLSFQQKYSLLPGGAGVPGTKRKMQQQQLLIKHTCINLAKCNRKWKYD